MSAVVKRSVPADDAVLGVGVPYEIERHTDKASVKFQVFVPGHDPFWVDPDNLTISRRYRTVDDLMAFVRTSVREYIHA